MTAALVTIAEAVKTDLALGPTIDVNGVATSTSGLDPRISHALTVQRLHVPRFDAPDQAADAYQVIVSPAGEETERLHRAGLQATYHVEIALCVKPTTLDNTSIDAALQVLQEMGDYFFDYGLTGGAAQWIRNDVFAWPDRDRLAQGTMLIALWDAVFVGVRER